MRANKLRDFIISIKVNDNDKISLIDTDEEMGESYCVYYSNQLLSRDGFVNEKPCKVIDIPRGYAEQKITVRFDDGGEEKINISDFQIPYNII